MLILSPTLIRKDKMTLIFAFLAFICFCFAIIIFDLGRREIQRLQYNISFLLRYCKMENFVFPDGEIVYPLKPDKICPTCGQIKKGN